MVQLIFQVTFSGQLKYYTGNMYTFCIWVLALRVNIYAYPYNQQINYNLIYLCIHYMFWPGDGLNGQHSFSSHISTLSDGSWLKYSIH